MHAAAGAGGYTAAENQPGSNVNRSNLTATSYLYRAGFPCRSEKQHINTASRSSGHKSNQRK